MKKLNNFAIPAVSKLFSGLTEKQSTDILSALGAVTIAYERGETIFEQWTKATHHYLVVSGEVHTYYSHTDGRRSINGVFRHGDDFALVFAFSEMKEIPSAAVAVRDSVVIKIPIVDIINNDVLIGMKERRRYIQNGVDVISESAFRARLRAFVLEQPTIEGRVMAYLCEKAKHTGSMEFEIPFSRQEFAEFLASNRCALSSVLGKMRDKGLIRFDGNRFRILRTE